MKVTSDLEQPEIKEDAGGEDENEKNDVKLPYFHGVLLIPAGMVSALPVLIAQQIRTENNIRLAARRSMPANFMCDFKAPASATG